MYLYICGEVVVIVHIRDSSTMSRGHRPRSCKYVVYGGLYVYIYMYMLGGGVDCAYMRLEYEVEGTSAA